MKIVHIYKGSQVISTVSDAMGISHERGVLTVIKDGFELNFNPNYWDYYTLSNQQEQQPVPAKKRIGFVDFSEKDDVNEERTEED